MVETVVAVCGGGRLRPVYGAEAASCRMSRSVWVADLTDTAR